jgi:neutral amino acid transport system permease protein
VWQGILPHRPTIFVVLRFGKMSSSKLQWIYDKPRWFRRTIIFLIVLIDATILGLLSNSGTLNLLDFTLGGSLPNDMIWLIQIIQSFFGGFGLLRVIFEDMRSSNVRSVLIFLTPVALFLLTLFTLDLLFKGQDKTASITFDIVALGTNTLIWSATYLSIAIGLTLTYKVQQYGNFAQAELFMVGMFVGMILSTSNSFYPLYEAPGDGVISWSLLLISIIAAFFLTGIVGIILDRAVYRGFRIRNASPQVMMIASLGVALMLRSIYFMRFGSSKVMFRPDSDFQHISNRWDIPTTKYRFNIGDLSLQEGSTYRQFNCEQSVDPETGQLVFDELTGEPVLSRIVSEGTKPKIEIYDVATDCATSLTSNFPYYKGALPAIVFMSVALLVILLNKTRLGMKMRAVADNPDLAASSGINVENIQMTSAFLSAGVTGIGGAIFSITLLFNPTTAFSLLLPSFAVIVLGTIGSVPGAIVASLIVGLVRAASSPILVGVGYPLERSGYSAMGGVMPYIFLIAILIILPKGIGDAWENWKIDRTRRKAKQKGKNLEKNQASLLAFLPTGIIGLHHLVTGNRAKAQNYSIIALGSYFLHKILAFIGSNSFSSGACSDLCSDTEGIESNLALLTGRNDGTLRVEDSPYFSETATKVDERWLELVEFELQSVNLLAEISDIIWPAIPLLLWIYAIYEGVDIIKDGKLSSIVKQTRMSVMGTLPLADFRSNISPIFVKMSRANTIHRETIIKLRSFCAALLYPIINSMDNYLKSMKSRLQAPDDSSGSIMSRYSQRFSLLNNYGREGATVSLLFFILLFILMCSILWWLPITSDPETFNWDKTFQLSNVIQSISIFVLMAFSLNLHTGYTGMVNFGVIFFVGVSAVTVCVLTAPAEMNGYGWGIIPASVFAISLSAALGWSLAYPTARLRTDYFAIVTISLGEILRLLLSAEPLLRTGPTASAIGLGSYPLPLKDWWFCGSQVEVGPGSSFTSANECRSSEIPLDSPSIWISDILNMGDPAPYSVLLALICITSVIIVWLLLNRVLTSPWGRILKSIREDEDVAQHHGHDVLRNKAASLALGAAIAGLAGILWAWKLTGIGPSFMSPSSTTFLVWAAFIIGGAANNRGMVIGAMIIILMESVFNVLVVASSPDLPLYDTANQVDKVFIWLVSEQWEVTKFCLALLTIGLVFRLGKLVEFAFWGTIVFAFTAWMMNGERALQSATNYAGEITISGAGMAYVKLLLIGSLMLFSLKYNPKGLLPEVPHRPTRPNGGEDA